MYLECMLCAYLCVYVVQYLGIKTVDDVLLLSGSCTNVRKPALSLLFTRLPCTDMYI